MNVKLIAAGLGVAAMGAALTVVVVMPPADMGPPIFAADYLLAHPQERSAILLQCATLSRHTPGCVAAVEAEGQAPAYERQAALERSRRIRELTCVGQRMPDDGC
jgi:hypothetical protein